MMKTSTLQFKCLILHGLAKKLKVKENVDRTVINTYFFLFDIQPSRNTSLRFSVVFSKSAVGTKNKRLKYTVTFCRITNDFILFIIDHNYFILRYLRFLYHYHDPNIPGIPVVSL